MKNTSLIKILLFSYLTLGATPLLAESTNSSSGGSSHLANDAALMANKTVNLIKDSAITAYIYAQIALDKNLNKESINVSTDKGTVTLAGTVDSSTEASTVVQLASSVSGVTAVNASKLTVKKSSQPFTDIMVSAKVKGTFIRENLVGNKEMPADIGVETKNGVVYLSGKASNTEQIQHAVNVAKAISGVKRVESAITLSSNEK